MKTLFIFISQLLLFGAIIKLAYMFFIPRPIRRLFGELIAKSIMAFVNNTKADMAEDVKEEEVKEEEVSKKKPVTRKPRRQSSNVINFKTKAK